MNLKSLIGGLTQRLQRSASHNLEEFRSQVFSAVYANLVSVGVPASVAAIIGELVTGVVVMFAGLFMIDAVYQATLINNTSVFWGVSVQLVSLTGTVFTVLGLLIIVVALSTAMASLKNMF